MCLFFISLLECAVEFAHVLWLFFFLSIWQLHHWGPNVSGTVVVSFEALLCHCMWHSVVLLAWFRLLVSLCSILEALCMGHRLFSFLLQFLWFHYHSLQVQSIDATRWWKCFQENILLFGLGPSRSRKPDSSKMYFII